jgi:hypothetical protein
MLDCTTDGCQLLPALVLLGGTATPTKSRPALFSKGMDDGQWYGGTNLILHSCFFLESANLAIRWADIGRELLASIEPCL